MIPVADLRPLATEQAQLFKRADHGPERRGLLRLRAVALERAGRAGYRTLVRRRLNTTGQARQRPLRGMTVNR